MANSQCVAGVEVSRQSRYLPRNKPSCSPCLLYETIHHEMRRANAVMTYLQPLSLSRDLLQVGFLNAGFMAMITFSNYNCDRAAVSQSLHEGKPYRTASCGMTTPPCAVCWDQRRSNKVPWQVKPLTAPLST